MENCLDGYNNQICVVYLDDILVFAPTFDQHVENLRKVLKRLQLHGVKLKPSKCKLFQRQITQQPVMAYPDFKLPFILHTDASNQGLASVLYQRQEGKLRAIAFASRTLSPREKNYHSNKLEFLALKWSITDRFRDYLQYAVNFTVFTDNNPLTYVLTTARLNATGQRWVSELASFRFNIKYRPGKRNNDADTLSRMPINVGNMEELVNDCVMEIPDGVIAAAKEYLQAIDKGDISCIDAVPCSLDAIETVTAAARPTLGSIDVDTLKAAQENDDTIGKVLEYKRQGHLPKQTERRQE
ncbi:hypothetical protein BSL78_16645 [Apostichopus japonicus]|uniref:Reverse transcriptase domain-containing protein n=1 Tax=Stichopus japonicus TaxID=307972 RepID=A0A2G8KER0_STIJA|nr:hypothetical protein BSL78_16645 [Apostichopus japonicus]